MNIGISLPALHKPDAEANDPYLCLAFLLMLLRSSPWVDALYLLDPRPSTSGATLHPIVQASGVRDLHVTQPQDVTHALDMVIELGARLPVAWLRHVRALGARIVLYLVEQPYTRLMEKPIFGRADEPLFNGAPWHEVWLRPSHAHAGLPLMRTLARVPVHEMPPLWSPFWLDQQVAALHTQGLAFGFDPESRRAPAPGWRVGIFDANVSVTSNCTVPLLACDHACRQQPGAVARVMATRTLHMKEHLTFNRLASSLDCTRQGKASYEPPLSFAEGAARFGLDAVVTHQWEDGLNDACHDVLAGGYPLVHNDPTLQRAGVGQYYAGFGAADAGQALLQAWAREPGYWQDHQRTSSAWLRRLSPTDPANGAAYQQRLQSAGSTT